MKEFEQKEYKVFEMFSHQTALVTAGDIGHFNGCTIGWGSLGNIWSRAGSVGAIVTVYVYPSRYTCEFLKMNDTFTVSFFPKEYQKALGYMGTHSGRDEDKVKGAGLTPVSMGKSVGYKEAELSFLCKKLYQHEFVKEDLDEAIHEYYKAKPTAFPPDANGDWQTHYMFVGEIMSVDDKRKLS